MVKTGPGSRSARATRGESSCARAREGVDSHGHHNDRRDDGASEDNPRAFTRRRHHVVEIPLGESRLVHDANPDLRGLKNGIRTRYPQIHSPVLYPDELFSIVKPLKVELLVYETSVALRSAERSETMRERNVRDVVEQTAAPFVSSLIDSARTRACGGTFTRGGS
jgi:hypothetical protein